MKTLISHLPKWNLQGKRVLVRADLNVPLGEGKILNDFRLTSLLPTLHLIKKKGGKIILLTHIGRPKKISKKLSTKQLVEWFKNNGFSVDFESEITKAIKKSHENNDTILLLENVRFFPQEQTHDTSFAQLLSKCGDYYINDAFGVLHRNDTSLTLLPLQFSPDNRSIGLLVEDELKQLNKFFKNPQKPFVLIIGGKKISTKIPLILNFLPYISSLLLCPATVFTFLKSQGKQVGSSLVDKEQIELCKQILKKAAQLGTSVEFPVDYLVSNNEFSGPFSIIQANQFTTQIFGIAIGPKTIAKWEPIIKNAKTIFYNGLMGSIEDPKTLEPANEIFKLMAESKGTSIIAGGDSVAAAQLLGYGKKIDYLSSGGGATLAYLSGKKLPGLEVLTT